MESQIKTMRYNYTSVRMAKIQNTDITKCDSWCEAWGILIHGGYTKWYTLWKTVGWFSTKLNMYLPYDPAIALLGIYLSELKTFVHTKSAQECL